MNHPSASPALAAPASISTRFGEIAIDQAKLLDFPQGLLGFEHRRAYILAEIAAGSAWFKLLQAVEDPSLGFVVAPLDPAAGLIASADLEQAARVCQIPWADALILMIVTLRRAGPGLTLTANLQAPLLIDTTRRIGRQHVFDHERYSLRHSLRLEHDHAG